MSETHFHIEPIRKELPPTVRNLGWGLLLIGVVVYVIGYLINPREAAFNNIIGFLFITSIAVGSIFLIALEYIAGAVWSVPMRRVNEFLGGLVLIAPIVALPMFFHLHDIFHWTDLGAVGTDELLKGKQPYLNLNFFIIRFIVVFALWNFFYWLFTRNSLKQDISKDQKFTTYNIRLAAVFLPVFAITLTITAVDWAMSLEPHWFSTILGVYYFSGTVLAAVATATYIIVKFHENGYLQNLQRDNFYSLGALLFAFINFWAYIAFSQFLLIWYANLPEETIWFMKRWQDGMQYVSVLLIIVHFAVPYFLLLPQEAKMNLKRLKFMAIWILFAHLLDLYWLVMPTYSIGVTIGWMEISFPVLILGLVILMLAFKMKRHNLIPVGDPKLERGIKFRL
jgi:hypothetical protein